MKNRFGVVVLVSAVALLVWAFYSVIHLIEIQYKGSPVTAKVLYVDTDCDKYNQITVVFENRSYRLNISRTDCRNKVYKVGQSVTLLKYEDENTLVWPEAQYHWVPFILIAVLAGGYYTNKEKFKHPRKPSPNSRYVK